MDIQIKKDAEAFLKENGGDFEKAFYKVFECSCKLRRCANCQNVYVKGTEAYCTLILDKIHNNEADIGDEWVDFDYCCDNWKMTEED